MLKLIQNIAHLNKTMIAAMPFWRLERKNESSPDSFHYFDSLFDYSFYTEFRNYEDAGPNSLPCYRNL